MAELDDDQKKAFQEAKQAASELMGTLYRIRNAFYKGNAIPPNGDGVWRLIPRAQSMVHEIEALIQEAELDATKSGPSPRNRTK